MVLIHINFDLPIPIYEQIASEIRRLIFEGQLKAGDSLASVRQVANDLGVNLNTVAQAYRLLEKQGLVQLRRGSGATVTGNRIHAAYEGLLKEQLRRTLIDLYMLGYTDQEVQKMIDHQHALLLEAREKLAEREGEN
ncbi:GntR family transcriptional regulator [Caldalkalibacillus uzonensis]|uniref:GntR family transcriptional regulator n=1 Tax=Caldalkalibacillus uzonensis TaxID=353224 RepID=A0ABU0CW68_9BACI|nr:GntR family transcriptional regulator [Caldalkalibacillus uzonensis]MDQ0340661.1 GntR family transcriptional regulator [Caldalkalibacillus uzonensis]